MIYSLLKCKNPILSKRIYTVGINYTHICEYIYICICVCRARINIAIINFGILSPSERGTMNALCEINFEEDIKFRSSINNNMSHERVL